MILFMTESFFSIYLIYMWPANFMIYVNTYHSYFTTENIITLAPDPQLIMIMLMIISWPTPDNARLPGARLTKT